MTQREITHIGDLTPEPRNARRHTPRNIGMIVDSLHEVGAARSIVIDEEGRVLAGNGTVEAAAEAGIERVQVVDADGNTLIAVRRTGLTEAQKRRLALYDNRTAELADWDSEVLAELMDTDPAGLEGLFAPVELDMILHVPEQLPDSGITGETVERLRVIITFEDENERAEFWHRLGTEPREGVLFSWRTLA